MVLTPGGAAAPRRDGAEAVLDGLARPVIVLVGHAGSGKTEIALNLAIGFRERGAEVTLVDLDVVKPYFRCRMARDELGNRGIRLIAPEGDHFYADLPILLPEARGAARAGAGSGRRVLVDVGGARLGARALGSLADAIDPAQTDLLFVVNARRPFAEDLASLAAVLADVQAAARIPLTGLVANTHLLEETAPPIVREGIRAARGLEAATGIPLRFCAMLDTLAPAFGAPAARVDGLTVLPLTRHILAPFALAPRGRTRPTLV